MTFGALFGLSIYWHLPILVLGISLVYSATRFDQWQAISRETVRWVLNLSGFLLGIGLVLYLLSNFI